MNPDRRTFLLSTGKLLVLSVSASVAWEAIVAGRPETAPNYTMTDHWWGMVVDIEALHRLRQLRAGLQGRERRTPHAAVFPHVGRALPRQA